MTRPGVTQNQGYNEINHIIYVLFFVVTFILCNPRQDLLKRKELISSAGLCGLTINPDENTRR